MTAINVCVTGYNGPNIESLSEVSELAKTRYRNEDYMRVFAVLHELYPPHVKWNDTVWRREKAIVKKVLFDQGYSVEDIVDAIRYAKLKGRNVYSIKYIPYIIEESIAYHKRLREREEAERLRQQAMESVNQTIAPAQPQYNAPSWLRLDEQEEIE
jgi:hypothetical protein